MIEASMHIPDLKSLSLDQLVELARDRNLIEDWQEEGDRVHLRVGIVEVTLLKNSAREYLRGLIRGHEIGQARNSSL